MARGLWAMARSRNPCRTVVDSLLTHNAPFAAGDERWASLYSSRGRCSAKNQVWRYPSGRLPPGKEVGDKAAATHGQCRVPELLFTQLPEPDCRTLKGGTGSWQVDGITTSPAPGELPWQEEVPRTRGSQGRKHK